jgi:hypothetical protein
MKVQHTYKQFDYYILSKIDKKELIHLLDEVKNPIDATINNQHYHEWNSAMIDEITKENLSIIIRERESNKMVGYMLLRDVNSPHSEKEISLSGHWSIARYNKLLEELESPFYKSFKRIHQHEFVKLVDSGVSKEYLKNGLAIHSLQWVVDYVRSKGYLCLLVEALSPVGVKLAKNMGNEVVNELTVDRYEGFEHLKDFKIQFTLQWLKKKSKL